MLFFNKKQPALLLTELHQVVNEGSGELSPTTRAVRIS